jgi:hypothetical protein
MGGSAERSSAVAPSGSAPRQVRHAPDQNFDRIARLAAKALHTPVAMVSLFEGDGQLLQGATGVPEPWLSRRRLPFSHSLCRRVLKDGAPARLNDLSTIPSLAPSGSTNCSFLPTWRCRYSLHRPTWSAP